LKCRHPLRLGLFVERDHDEDAAGAGPDIDGEVGGSRVFGVANLMMKKEEMKAKEMKAKEMKEKEMKAKEVKEKEVKEKEVKEKKEMLHNSN
jgi:hypothetical protein